MSLRAGGQGGPVILSKKFNGFGREEYLYPCEKIEIQRETPQSPAKQLPLLRPVFAFLLEMPLRVQYMPGLHAGKYLGNVVQWNYLAMPGLRRAEWIWQSVMPNS
ncbi:MAG: hypothetical protein JRJ46_07825 [Deltaproteobacteria bacterium]|nr:hypothetical protein [Deltaproteobacteria bacterium]